MEGQKYRINHCSIFYIRDWVLFRITLTVKLRKFCIKRADKSPIPIERRLKVLVSRVNPPTRYHRRQNFPLYCKRSSAERNPRWKKTFFQLMNGTLIWSLSICKTKMALKGMAMKQSPFLKKETFHFDFDDYVCSLTELILPAPLNLPSQVHL